MIDHININVHDEVRCAVQASRRAAVLGGAIWVGVSVKLGVGEVNIGGEEEALEGFRDLAFFQKGCVCV